MWYMLYYADSWKIVFENGLSILWNINKLAEGNWNLEVTQFENVTLIL